MLNAPRQHQQQFTHLFAHICNVNTVNSLLLLPFVKSKHRGPLEGYSVTLPSLGF